MLPLLAILCLAAPASERVERRVALMGTTLELVVEASDRPTALRASEAALRAVEAVERRLSSWRTDSELAAVNQAPLGQWVTLSPELAHDLALARDCWQATEGAFDPTVGALVEVWGVREGGRQPSPAARREALTRTGFQQLSLDGRRARREAAITFDAGGFGKGVALDAGLDAAEQAGASATMLDLGGQIAVRGERLRVGLADPSSRQRAVAALLLSEGSIATSSHSEHPGHLLDPRSGRPSPDFGSVSVRSSSATWADCLSTGLYALGPEAALAWSAQHPEVTVLILPYTRDTP